MANAQTIEVRLKAISDFGDVTSSVKQIQGALSQLKLPPNLQTSFTKTFSQLETATEKASQAMANGFKTKGDVSGFEKNIKQINALMAKLQADMQKVDPSILEKSFNIDSSKLAAATKVVEDLKKQIASMQGENGLTKLSKAIQEVKDAGSNAKSLDKFFNAIQQGNIPEAQAALKQFAQAVNQVSTNTQEGVKKQETYKAALDQMNETLLGLKNNTALQDKVQELQQANQALENLGEEEFQKFVETYAKLANISIGQAVSEVKQLGNNQKKVAQGQQQINSQLDQFKQRLTYFFGAQNAVNLLKRTIRDTIATVKDLDKVMTETAVVTDFDVGDMWSQLPEYTERASELGVSIHGAYEAATLYYQQGLKTNEVMAVSNETLKMARIAGLEAADATDRMTNALRGFNMEITQANAQNINDVYSNLAAKTASNVDEISTAMTKVASLANNANMSFENTAAFLSQIIETTRESAETAGTALKTVIARFSEVKELYSKGDLLGTDSEGLEIDVNKVSKALRTAGIDLNEYLTGAKGLDQIFMELSQKWDSLDQVQQRYIATMAAGSRQQSRFIALMQDNARMTELVGYANNAAGASQKQFEKTLESFETKVNKLKNAWDTFKMGIANDGLIKLGIDALTGILNVVNKLTGKLPGLIKSIANLGVVIGGLRLGKKVFEKIIGNLGQQLGLKGVKDGKEYAKGLESGVKTAKIKLPKFVQATEAKQAAKQYSLAAKGLDQYSKGAKQTIELTKQQNDMIKRHLPLQAEQIGNLDEEKKMRALMAASVNDYAKSMGMSTEQAKASLLLQQKGYSQDVADLAVTKELTSAELGQIIATNGEAAAEENGAIATSLKTAQTKLQNKQESKNLILKLKSGIANAKDTVQQTAAGVARLFGAGAQATLNVQMGIGLAIIGAITIAIVALIAVVYALVKAYQSSSPERRMRELEEATESAKQQADEANESYQTLKDTLDSISDHRNTLKDMVVGTDEWKQEVQALNKQVLDLLENYKDLQFYVDNDGVLHLTPKSIEDAKKQAEEEAFSADFTANQLERSTVMAERDVIAKNSRSATSRGEGTNAEKVGETAAAWGAASIGLPVIASVTALGGIVEGIYDVVKWMGGEQVHWFETTAGILKGGVDQFVDLYNGQTIEADVTEAIYDAIELGDVSAFGQNSEAAMAIVTSNDNLATKINKLGEFFGLVGDEIVNSQENAKKYLQYGEQLHENSERLEQLTEAEEARIKTATNLDTDTGTLARLYNSAVDRLSAEKQAQYKSDSNLEDDYAKYKGYTDAEDYQASTKKKINKDIAAKELAAAQAGKILLRSAKALSEESKNLDKNSRVRKAFSEGGSKSLTRANLKGGYSGWSTYKNESGYHFGQGQRDQLWDDWNKLTEQARGTFKDFNDFADQIAEAYGEAQEKFEQTDKQWDEIEIGAGLKQAFENAFSNVSADTYSAVSDKFFTVISASGEQSATKIAQSFSVVTKDMNPQEVQNFASQLSMIDWTSADDIDAFIDQLDQLDLHVDYTSDEFKELIKNVKEGAHATRSFNLEEFTNNVKTLGSILTEKIEVDEDKDGKNRIFSEEEYKALTETLPDTVNDFVMGLDGNYHYLGSNMEDLGKAIRQNTNAILKERQQQLKNQIDAANIINDSFKDRLNNRGDLNRQQQQQLFNDITSQLKSQKVDLGKLGIAGLTDDSTATSFTDAGLSTVLDNLMGIVNKQQDLEQEQKQITSQVLSLTAQTNSPTGNYVNYNNAVKNGASHEEISAYSDALLVQAQSAQVSQKALEGLQEELNSSNEAANIAAAAKIADITETYKQAAALGVNTQQLSEYTEALMANNKSLDANVAAQIALRNTRLNTGLSEIIDDYDNWTKLINKSTGTIKATTSQDVLEFNKLKKSVNAMLNTTEDLSDEFWNSKQNMDNLKKAARGSKQAIEELQMAAAQDQIKQLQENVRETGRLTEDAQTAFQEFSDFLKDFNPPKLEAGQVIDDKSFVTAFNNLISDANLTADEIQKAAQSMGYSAKIKWANDTRTIPATHGHRTYTRDEFGMITDWDEVITQEPVTVTGQFPVIETLTSNGSGGGGISIENHNKSKDLNQSLNNKGSDSKKDKPKQYQSSYDKLYNLLEKINALSRERNELQREYEKSLKNSNDSLAKTRGLYYDQLDTLQAEKQLRQQAIAGRKQQLATIGSKTHEMEDGSYRSYSSLGVTQAAYLDPRTNTVTINQAYLNSLRNDPQRGAAAEEYIAELERIRDGINEQTDAIYDIEDQIEQMQEEAINDYLEYEQKVMDALVGHLQKQIDGMQALSEVVSESNSRMLEQMRKSVELQRKIRDNTEKEQQIEDIERRLSYLRMDTSGNNRQEIRKLQKELSSKRQSIADTRTDDALSKIEENNQKAEQQRNQQIQIAQKTLDKMVANGELWDDVYKMIDDVFSGRVELKNSDLFALVKEQEGYFGMSVGGQKKFTEDMYTSTKKAMIGRDAFIDMWNVDPLKGAKENYYRQSVENSKKASTPASINIPGIDNSVLKDVYDKYVKKLLEDILATMAVLTWGLCMELKAFFQKGGIDIGPILKLIGNGADFIASLFGPKHEKGGLVDKTGPAWLDGTKSKPEMVLSARDTENFIELKNVLGDLVKNNGLKKGESKGESFYDIHINNQIASDYDVQRMIDKVKDEIAKSATYRNVPILSLRR